MDNDVYEAARCFTGWRVDYSSWEPGVGQSGAFLYYPAWHDRANKFFMQQYIHADQAPLKDGQDVLDAIAAHPGTARHIARKLCRRLIGDNPPQDTVDAAAAVFSQHKDSADQLKQVVRSIVLSEAFRNTYGEKVKRPFDAAASFLRITDAEFIPSDEFGWNYDDMGQPLFAMLPPMATRILKKLDRHHLAAAALAVVQCPDRRLGGWHCHRLAQPDAGNMRTPNAIADFWINRILGGRCTRQKTAQRS